MPASPLILDFLKRLQVVRPVLADYLQQHWGTIEYTIVPLGDRTLLGTNIPWAETPPEVRAQADDRQVSNDRLSFVVNSDDKLGLVIAGTLEAFVPGPALDGKFTGVIQRRRDGVLVPDDRWVGFMAYDNAFPATLRFYREECARIGADQEQLQAVDRLIGRVDAWRAAHPELIKIPDALPGECP
jgi:hypothetical protein